VRTLIRSAIVADATLQSLGVVSAGVLMGEVDTPPERPFIQLRWGITLPGVSTVNTRTLIIWVHDRPGDYTLKVDPILARLRTVLAGVVGQTDGTGHLVDADWTGDSEDLIDEGHGTITRTASFAVVGSGQ
jgi:hypothetical protein